MERYFQNAVVGIIEFDAAGRLARANTGARRMLGFPEDEMMQMTWRDIVHPDDIAPAIENFEPLAHDGLGDVLEVRCRTKTGFLPVAVNVHAGEKDADGRPGYFVAFLMDMSKQKEAEHNAHLRERQLRDLNTKIGKALCDALEARDPYTSGHQDQVALVAAAIGRNLGLAVPDMNAVVAAATVHDIGKIGVPSEYLAKPGKLDAIEWAVIKTHAKKGYDILKPMETEFPVAEIVYQHHERLDGSGYPRGLKNGAILEAAQIVAVADLADSIIHPRPYRKALGMDFALSILKQERGTKFIPDIADAGAEVIRSFPWDA